MIFHLNDAVLLVSIALAVPLAYLAHERRVPGANVFSMILIGTVVREVARAEITSTASTAGKLFCVELAAAANCLTPPLWFLFAFAYSAPRLRLPPRVLALLWTIPVALIILIFINGWRHLFWHSVTRSSPAADASLILVRGPLFAVALAYGAFCLLAGLAIMARTFTRLPAYYRGQAAVMVVAVLCYGVSNATYQLSLAPVSRSNLTTTGFVLAEVIWFWGIFRYRIFDLLPVARDVVVESMSDGVIVLDTARRVVDCNQAALRMLGTGEIVPIGRRIDDVWQAWRDLETAATTADHRSTREIRAPGAATSYLEVQTVPVLPRRNHAGGVLLLLRDITDRRQAETALQTANAHLQAQLAENLILQERLREEAIRDPLTGLYNRRFLHETLFRELAHATREGSPLTVVIIDIDHFKRLNDRYGHQIGDLVLQALATLLRTTTRGEDVVCRYGGEEFVIVLPGASLVDAMVRVEVWRADFTRLNLSAEAGRLTATFSAGVADFPAAGRSGDDLIRAADQALYVAKGAGRNRVVAWRAARPLTSPARESVGRGGRPTGRWSGIAGFYPSLVSTSMPAPAPTGGRGCSPASISARRPSRKGGRASRSPRCAASSSVAKPGPSVAISNRIPPGSRK